MAEPLLPDGFGARSVPGLRNDPSVRPTGGALAGILFLVGLAVATQPVVGQVPAELVQLSQQLASSRTAGNYASVQGFADRASGVDRHLALYSVAMARYSAKEYAAAESAFASVSEAAGWLGEYAAYFGARCVVLAEEFERALPLLADFVRRYPDSRYQPSAERLQVESLLRLQRLDQARAMLARDASNLEEPVRLYLSGRVEHVAGRLQTAVGHYRAAYYFYPFSDQAEASEAHLNRLRARMGDAYPSAPASRRFERAQRLYDGASYAKARDEYSRALSAGLGGTAREMALVRRGAADYHLRRTSQAYSALARLRLEGAEVRAERLYWLCALERRRGMVDEMLSSLEKLASQHPGSNWYQEALLTVGNYYYLKDDRREYLRLFQQLARSFPRGEHAPYAHWRVCWRAWLDDSRQRRRLLTEHIEMFPDGPNVAGAVYWLGRLHEEEILPAEAQGHYRAVAEAFPNYYYAILARERLGTHDGGRIERLVADEIIANLPDRRELVREPSPSMRAVIETGTVLGALGLHADATEALHLADYRKPDSHLAGLELGRLHAPRDEHFEALRAMKRYVFGYLRFPVESLDEEYWRYLYPLGWEDSLRARSERHELDPHLVAALIRQESEFHPGARSRAGALGLMQIMPGTGRILFRRLGIPGFSSRKLTQPDLSLRLGTFHLKEVLEDFDWELEKALAGYNAGERRIEEWMALGPFDEPAEFVEAIPFSETRGYVQSVLRNREMYERLYGN